MNPAHALQSYFFNVHTESHRNGQFPSFYTICFRKKKALGSVLFRLLPFHSVSSLRPNSHSHTFIRLSPKLNIPNRERLPIVHIIIIIALTMCKFPVWSLSFIFSIVLLIIILCHIHIQSHSPSFDYPKKVSQRV